MRKLIEYLRSCFCRHDFEHEEEWRTLYGWDDFGNEYLKKKDIKVSATCKACGYHKSYWKF